MLGQSDIHQGVRGHAPPERILVVCLAYNSPVYVLKIEVATQQDLMQGSILFYDLMDFI